MEMIGVSASASKAGKTTLISLMLEDSCAKTAVIKTSINNQLDQYKVINDPKVINQAGTDTARVVEHGADKVILLESPAAELPSAYQLARNLLDDDIERLFIEGNTIINFLNPDLLFYLENKDEPEKESAKMVKNRANIKINTNSLLSAGKLNGLPFTIQPEKMTCYQAHLLADLLKMSVPEIGKIVKEQNVKIVKCQLGLF
jgi:molybdopterin-guanine dinucleotide biosynthesis protein